MPLDSLVSIPVYNEAERIRRNVLTLYQALRDSGLAFKLAIVEDGSTDGTKEAIEDLSHVIPGLITRCGPIRLGRGQALRTLWSTTNADAYCYVDSDLPAGPDAVISLLNRVQDGADVVTGSRYMVGAIVNRPPMVYYSSRFYNLLVNVLFHDGVADHQCGMKAFSADAVHRLLPIVSDDSWFWDTEMILRAKSLNLRVEEIPLHWTEKRYFKTSTRRLFHEAPYFLARMVSLKGELEAQAAHK